MATAKTLDQEASSGERPQRPEIPPPGAPHSAVLPDLPDSAEQRQATEAEQRRLHDAEVPAGGLPEGIPHGDRVVHPPVK